MKGGPTWHGDPVLNANHCSAAWQTPWRQVSDRAGPARQPVRGV